MTKIVYLSSHYSADEDHSIVDHEMAGHRAINDLAERTGWVIFDYSTAFVGADDTRDRERILALECAIVANCDLVVMLDDHEEYSAGMIQEQAAAIAAGVPVVKFSEVMR